MSARLYTGTSPDFFRGTALEEAVAGLQAAGP